MTLLYIISCLCLMLCASCQRDFSVKPKTNPYTLKLAGLKRPSKGDLTPKEYQKQIRTFEKKRGAAFRKPILTMNSHELKEAYAFARMENNSKRALRYLERMAAIETDLTKLKDLRLEIADIYFDVGDLEKAESLYADFLTLYPGSKTTEYAEYKAILCSFYQTLESEFDQTKTKQSLQLSQAFLDKKEHKQYTLDVAAINKECLTTLFESEVNIINFYLNKNKIDGAQQRLASIKEQFVSLPRSEVTIAKLEYDLAKKQNNETLLKEAKLSLEQVQQKSSPVLAQHSEQRGYASRF